MVKRMKPVVAPAGKTQPTFWGVGPSIGSLTAIHFAVVFIIDRLTTPAFQIASLSQPAAIILGLSLITLGIALYLFTLRALMRARSENQLITTGPYRLVRHPLYTIALFLLCPGFCVMFRSWLVLSTIAAQAVAVWLFLGREEQALLETFGEDYEDYKRKTPAVIPFMKPARD